MGREVLGRVGGGSTGAAPNSFTGAGELAAKRDSDRAASSLISDSDERQRLHHRKTEAKEYVQFEDLGAANHVIRYTRIGLGSWRQDGNVGTFEDFRGWRGHPVRRRR